MKGRSYSHRSRSLYGKDFCSENKQEVKAVVLFCKNARKYGGSGVVGGGGGGSARAFYSLVVVTEIVWFLNSLTTKKKKQQTKFSSQIFKEC